MAMSVGGEGGDDTPISDINTTPLVDVMLVLLIIFLITVPVVLQTIPLKLPTVRNEPTVTKPENVNLSVKADAAGNCQVYWGIEKVDSKSLLDRAVKKLKFEIDKQGGVQNVTPDTLPEAHIRGDQNTPYKCIGGVVSTLSQAGFLKVGFISQPETPGGP
ncbi:ExbD/TolR family protein [Sphingomonas oryzagri]|uniref:Biopolymer transporter ExbD n=1 Tax=Sphingomonas oryzagri TaxID=3042314 RepID=A0ABT6N3S1_9SPHN|nr:biopolymer transporter ExbD [Sphingomonas oryzagri]MDH7639701.1 biopolymer transporter ExbD [Sphingomonas oryzagri]